MKGLCFIILILLTFNVCAQGDANSVVYIKINSFNSPNINVSSIDDFFQLMHENKVKNVFFNNDLFIIQGSSIVYTIQINGYKNLVDYKNGFDKNFVNGAAYYFALENNLPDQKSVDYYKSEGFLTNSDYHDAVLTGFTKSNVPLNDRRIYGLITEADLKKNIRYLNILIYLQSYKNWQFYEDQIARQNVNTARQSGNWQSEESSRLQREKLDQQGLELLKNTSIEQISNLFGRNTIKKLNFFDYYLIDIPIASDKDCMFYYASKFCQYPNISDFKNNKSGFMLSGTEQIYKKLFFDSLNDFLDADSAKISNGKDYNLMFSYYISLEELNQNRNLITELEGIKQKYLTNINFDWISGTDRVKSDFRANFERYSYNYYSANKAERIAFVIYNLLKLKKGESITFSNFAIKVREEYSQKTIYSKFAFDEYWVSLVLNNVPQVKTLFSISPDSFYRK